MPRPVLLVNPSSISTAKALIATVEADSDKKAKGLASRGVYHIEMTALEPKMSNPAVVEWDRLTAREDTALLR